MVAALPVGKRKKFKYEHSTDNTWMLVDAWEELKSIDRFDPAPGSGSHKVLGYVNDLSNAKRAGTLKMVNFILEERGHGEKAKGND